MTGERTVDPGNTLARILSDAVPELRKIAPKYVNLQRLMQLAIEAKMRNPMLAQCSPVSVLNFCKKCAETGTDRVGPGGMHAVPFFNSKTNSYDMTPIPDWRLLIEKAKRAGAIKHAHADVVREGDDFSYGRGLDPYLSHTPRMGNTGRPVAAYCVYILPDGTKDFEVMEWERDVLPIRNRSKAWQSYEKDHSKTCPWNTDELEMGKKTVVKRAMKLFEGASIELSMLIETDNLGQGFIEPVEIREPIAMPKELPPPAAQDAPGSTNGAEGGQSPQDGASDDPGAPQGKVVVGAVEKVQEKSGVSHGKPWTRFGILLAGQWYNTFDTKFAVLANQSRAEGFDVKLTYTENSKGFKDIVALDMAQAGDVEQAGEDQPITLADVDRFAAEVHQKTGKDLGELDAMALDKFAAPLHKLTRYQLGQLKIHLGA